MSIFKARIATLSTPEQRRKKRLAPMSCESLEGRQLLSRFGASGLTMGRNGGGQGGGRSAQVGRMNGQMRRANKVAAFAKAAPMTFNAPAAVTQAATLTTLPATEAGTTAAVNVTQATPTTIAASSPTTLEYGVPLDGMTATASFGNVDSYTLQGFPGMDQAGGFGGAMDIQAAPGMAAVSGPADFQIAQGTPGMGGFQVSRATPSAMVHHGGVGMQNAPISLAGPGMQVNRRMAVSQAPSGFQGFPGGQAFGPGQGFGKVQGFQTATSVQGFPGGPAFDFGQDTPGGPDLSQGLGMVGGIGFQGDFSPGHGFGGDHFGGPVMQVGSLPEGVATAQATLQADLKVALPHLSVTPSAESLQALQADLKAVHDGTLTGTEAETKLQVDRDNILISTGLTADQVANLKTAQDAYKADLEAVRAGTLTGSEAETKLRAGRDNILLAQGATAEQVAQINADEQALRATFPGPMNTVRFAKTGGSDASA